MKHRGISVFTAAVLLIAAGQTAIASQATVTDDSYSNQAKPTTTSGTLPQVLVDSADHAFFKFDLSQLPAGITAAQVSKATLTLWVYGEHQHEPCGLHRHCAERTRGRHGTTRTAGPNRCHRPSRTGRTEHAGATIRGGPLAQLSIEFEHRDVLSRRQHDRFRDERE